MSKLIGNQEFNGDVYVKDVGGYDGTNATASTVETIQTVLNTHIDDTTHHLGSVTSEDDGKVLTVVDGAWCAKTPSEIYYGTGEPDSSLGNNGDVYFQVNPGVLYETNGTTGLLGHNQSDYAGNWQLEDLDLTPYRFIRCYFRSSTSTDATAYTPAVVVEVPLETAAMGTNIYAGSQVVALPFDRSKQYLISCAVDNTKTKFQVIHQNILSNNSVSDANSGGRYLYKIEGYI